MRFLIKNKKYTFMIIFFICSFFFIDNASAYISKGTDTTPYTSSNLFSGSINNNGAATLTLEVNTPVQKNGFDLIGFRFGSFNFRFDSSFSIDNPYLASDYGTHYLTCVAWENANTCRQWSFTNNNTTTYPQDLYGSTTTGTLFVRAELYDDQNNASPCYLSSEMENYLLCPVQTNFKRITILLYNKGYDRIYYDINVGTVKNLYNYDSTEIVNALNGVQTTQQSTISAIEQQTQQQAQQNAYIQNSNISQAQTNTSDSITVLNDQLTSELSQFSDLTQLVVAPITMFMELNNNVCAPLTLQIPFVNQTAVLPCIKPIMTQYFGGMYSVFTTVIGAILCYWTFVRTVALIKDLVDADNDKIEVVDL